MSRGGPVKGINHAAAPMLTDEERSVVEALGHIWNRLCKLTGTGPSRSGDLAEAVHHIHALQNMVMAQAAARAYPGEFRLLGMTCDTHYPDRAAPLEPGGEP